MEKLKINLQTILGRLIDILNVTVKTKQLSLSLKSVSSKWLLL